MAKKTTPVSILQDPEAPVAVEVLAEAIVRFSDAAQKMLDAGLTKRAIQILLRDRMGGISLDTIGAVLDALPTLKDHYVTPQGRAKVKASK